MSRRVLTLVRHAKSSWRLGSVGDRHRPLNARGLRDCQRVPEALASRIAPPELVITSDATRALQTTESLARAFELTGPEIVVEPDLYLASPVSMCKIAARHGANREHVALVGHNPGTTELYNWLSGRYLDNMPTFGVAQLELALPGWEDLASREAGGSASVIELIFPKQL